MECQIIEFPPTIAQKIFSSSWSTKPKNPMAVKTSKILKFGLKFRLWTVSRAVPNQRVLELFRSIFSFWSNLGYGFFGNEMPQWDGPDFRTHEMVLKMTHFKWVISECNNFHEKSWVDNNLTRSNVPFVPIDNPPLTITYKDFQNGQTLMPIQSSCSNFRTSPNWYIYSFAH